MTQLLTKKPAPNKTSPAASAPAFMEVAIPLPVRSTFHYKIPKALQKTVQLGMRVRVPFGRRYLVGYIVAFPKKPDVATLKPASAILDETPLLDASLIKLTHWIAQTYQAGWGETIEAAIPAPLRRGTGKRRRSATPVEETPIQPNPEPTLTPEQQVALEALETPIQEHRHAQFLLHGVTSSGKTEVYLQAIQKTLDQGRCSIVLVPEIALTPQTIERFEGRFGRETVAVVHSRILGSERLAAWQRIHAGEARVVVGARSAVFAPVQNLGLIVIDEEHEPSYKQEDAPRYHAREVALARAQLTHSVLLMGSATPSLEKYHQAGQEKPQEPIQLLTLPKRIDAIPLPEVQIIDMRRELSSGRGNRMFSRTLEDAVEHILAEKQQAILFLNRRGFSTLIHCRGCGMILKCKSCKVAMTYHVESKAVICHYCHATAPAPESCPECKGATVRFSGMGTQRVESELAKRFPQARIARMDTDSTKKRGAHEKILKEFSTHQTDILVGTQMVAKGLDFPRVTLVGVISADTALNLPDFRSAERTFNLLTQVAGRAGRRQLPGKVIVQTFTPHHYAILAASQHDYPTFFSQEIQIRQQLKLPPFTRLVQLTVRSMSESKANQFAETLAQACRTSLPKAVTVLGPAPSAIRRLRRQYRWQVILKSPTLAVLDQPLTQLLQKVRPPRGSYLAVNVDPMN